MKSVGKTAMLGSLPPLRALSGYCLALAAAMAEQGEIEFISFKEIYPRRLYPGGGLRDDHTFPAMDQPALTVRRKLTWSNPLTWISEGLFTRAPLLHAQWWSLPLGLIYFFVCGGFKLRRKPVVFTVHNVLPHDASPLFIHVSRLLFRLGDHFIVHTEQNRRQLMAHYRIPADRVSLIPHGLLDFHVNSEADRTAIRREMGFRPGDKVILLFGAIRSYKGVDTALEAFSRVYEKIPRARLLIAGKTWEDWTPYARRIEALNIQKAVV
ncbi:MAG: glycosyltransferase family 4 protein, partial [Desulfobacterales bacterium]|nr:glycosyltransferase family 4 protein [Desulfobacterales bacterium]